MLADVLLILNKQVSNWKPIWKGKPKREEFEHLILLKIYLDTLISKKWN